MVKKVLSIVQSSVYFILLASIVPTLNLLCTPCGLVKEYGLDTFTGKAGPYF